MIIIKTANITFQADYLPGPVTGIFTYVTSLNPCNNHEVGNKIIFIKEIVEA